MNEEKKDIILQTLKAKEQGELLNFLVDSQVRKSRSAIKSLLSHKQIKVNTQTVTQFNHELAAGDVVTIHKANNAHNVKRLKGMTIIFEDEYLIVAEKDAGLLSIATDKEKSETAYTVISQYMRISDPKAKAFVIFRLDRDASGLMLYAKSPLVQDKIQKAWDATFLTRAYAAVVEGRPDTSEGTITTWLTEDKNFMVFSTEFDNGGLKAVTHFQTLKSNKRFTLLRLNPETGRKNQVRVHMKHISHPIVGDKKYGARINPIKRIALHANELVIRHPMTNEVLEFKSAVPDKMKKLLDVTPKQPKE